MMAKNFIESSLVKQDLPFEAPLRPQSLNDFVGQDAIREVLSRGRKIEPTTYITKINVVMNESGEVVAMTVLEGSSLDELDDAPKKAFWKIARFPNPPIQLVESDGLIRLTYEFHFEWKSSFFNIVPWQI